jgi:hypothetical protein
MLFSKKIENWYGVYRSTWMCHQKGEAKNNTRTPLLQFDQAIAKTGWSSVEIHNMTNNSDLHPNPLSANFTKL